MMYHDLKHPAQFFRTPLRMHDGAGTDVVVQLSGGLGNRIFQLALGLSCATVRPDLNVGFRDDEQVGMAECLEGYVYRASC